MEDIPVTIVGIEQNSLINGPTNRSSLTACLHEGGVVSYPDPDYHSCGWITSPLRGRGSGQMPNQSRSESARF